MNVVVLYVGAVGSCLVAALLIRNTSPFTMGGGDDYQWRVRRRMLAHILFVLGALCFLAGVIGQVDLVLDEPAHLSR